MYAKINGGTVVKFPYSFGELRKDNPNVSFPRNISSSIMGRYGMVAVTDGTQPTPTVYQKVVRNAAPTIVEGSWQIDYTLVDMTAEEITEKDETTAAANRTKRNKLLADTDYLALSDMTLSSDMTTYRQALRDITSHANWPHLNDADWPVKP